jgi:hypothetical protein
MNRPLALAYILIPMMRWMTGINLTPLGEFFSLSGLIGAGVIETLRTRICQRTNSGLGEAGRSQNWT